MPFSFYVSVPVLYDFSLKEEDIPEELKKETDYFSLVIDLGESYFRKRLELADTLLLFEYLEAIRAFTSQHLKLEKTKAINIQKEYSKLLSPDAVAALTEVMLVARNIMLEKVNLVELVEEVDQIHYMNVIQTRLVLMVQVFGLLSNNADKDSDYYISASAFLLALLEDACGQLKNIAHGLYYEFYTQNFEDLTMWFVSNWNATATIFAQLSQQVKNNEIPQDTLKCMLPVFILSMDRVRHAAAYYFAHGNNEHGKALLEESAAYNATLQPVFNSASEKGADLFLYESVLKKHAENVEGFELDTPLYKYRVCCFQLLTAVRIFDESELKSTIKINAIKINKYIATLNTAHVIDEQTLPILKEGIVLLAAMAVKNYSQPKQLGLEYVDSAKEIVQRLNFIFERQTSNIVLIQVQAYLLKYAGNMKSCVDSIQSKLAAQKTELDNLKKIVAQQIQQEKTPQQARKTKSKKSPPSYQGSEDGDKKLKEVRQALKQKTAALEIAKQELLKVSHQCTSLIEKSRGQKHKDQKNLEKIEQLKKEIALAQEKNTELKEKIATAAPNDKEGEDAQTVEQVQNELDALELQIKENAQKNAQERAQLQKQHREEINKQEKAASKLKLLQVQNKSIQEQLQVLELELQKNSVEQEEALAQLEIQHEQALAKEQEKNRAFLLKSSKDVTVYSQLHEQNKQLHLELEVLEKAQEEEHQQYQQHYQQACSMQAAQAKVSDTVISTLEAALKQKQRQCLDTTLRMRVSDSDSLVFSSNLAEKLDEEPILIAECLSFSFQLNKPFCEKDWQIIYERIPKLLLSKELNTYLQVFNMVANHVTPLYSFQKLYQDNLLHKLIPLEWPTNPQIIQDWLTFMGTTLSVMNFCSRSNNPINAYDILNLILIAPYYAQAQVMGPSVSKSAIIIHLVNELIKKLPNIQGYEQSLLKSKIKTGLHDAVSAFQIWSSSRLALSQNMSAPALLFSPAPLLSTSAHPVARAAPWQRPRPRRE